MACDCTNTSALERLRHLVPLAILQHGMHPHRPIGKYTAGKGWQGLTSDDTARERPLLVGQPRRRRTYSGWSP